MITPIETAYAGCRFRSRLEARWAVFFDTAGIRWEYEPQGYRVGDRRRPYLPDFLLSDCGTWIEVKGSGSHLDPQLIEDAARNLPRMPYEREPGPRLMLLGPIPEPRTGSDWGWLGLSPERGPDGTVELIDSWWGFGNYTKNLRPWSLDGTSRATPYATQEPRRDWITPAEDPYALDTAHAYAAARSARFEHGESGA